ncbi:MAG: cytochrome P450 [Gemmatimonadota bacterium]|nr:cytochrome P450 [Gemmatimonadota bacterium]MDQ8146910.1 cytochrome P450 [Gemmatimonadota bacterium]MDQ8177590.1 cytochrome P450 [Gemmatimonadota bacterium]
MFEPSDPAFAADPYPTYDWLRTHHPVFDWAADGTFLLSRYADVHATWRDRRFGTDYRHRFGDASLPDGAVVEPWRGGAYPAFAAYARWDLLAMEPPDHTRLRRLVTEAFTPRAVAAQREPAAAMVRAALARAGEVGQLDVVRDLAEPLSLQIIGDLIGVPAADRALVLGWSHEVVRMYEPSATATERSLADAAVSAFTGYVGALIAERRRAPRADLLSGLLDAMHESERLDDAQVTSTVMLLLMAGHEASVNAAANGVAAFAAHPGEWARLREGVVPVAAAVEEVLRWDPPLQLFRRWVLEDGVVVADTALPRGSRVGLLIGAANRDPARYAMADRFDIGRGEPSHLAFGGGIHFCLGAPLARLELQILFEALAGAVPCFERLPGARRRPGFQFRGYSALPIAAH